MSLTGLCNSLVVSRLTDDMGTRVQEKSLPNGPVREGRGEGRQVVPYGFDDRRTIT
jgi:hypothetical protein